MTKKKKSGRPSLFASGHVKEYSVRGRLTQTAGAAFEHQRDCLRDLYLEVTGTMVDTISDAEVLEFLVRGTQNTRAFFEQQQEEHS